MSTLQTATLAFTLGMFCGLFANETQTNNIPVIRVTAWRFQDSKMDVPANVQVITSDQINQSHAQNVPNLLQDIANVRFRSATGKGNGGELAMRGFGENSGQRVLVLVDGQKMNRADMGGINWQQLPVNDIQSIEVIRGSQTVLYGHHALSGVIKITTRKGGDPKLKLKAETGSFGFEEYGISYSAGTNRFFYDVGATAQRDDGYRDHSESHNKNINARFGYYLGDHDSLTFRVSGGKTYQQFPGSLTHQQFKEDPTQSSNPGDRFYRADNITLTTDWETDRDWGILSTEAGFTQRDIEFEMSGTSGKNKQQGFSSAVDWICATTQLNSTATKA